MPSALARHWALDPAVTFLNHGSFGACPRAVLAAQRAWRDRMEAEPVRFLARELDGPPRRGARARSGRSSAPIRTTSRSSRTRPARSTPSSARCGSSRATRSSPRPRVQRVLNVLRHVAARDGARVVVVPLPFPATSDDDVVDAGARRRQPTGRGSPSSATSRARRRSSSRSSGSSRRWRSAGSTRSSTAPTRRG